MYNAVADIHLSCVYTPSHENPTPTPNNVITINMFSLQLPKSGDKNVISHDIVNTNYYPYLHNFLAVKIVQLV